MSILKAGMYASQFPTEQNYLTFSSDAPFSIKFNQISWDGVLEYSVDAQNWYEWDASEITSSGNVLYLRGSGNSYITGAPAVGGQASYAMQITATEGVECAGNIMSLLDHVNPDDAVMGYGAFASLFFEQDKLITSPELPATVLAPFCYSRMLYECINLTAAPDMPATTLANSCYSYMCYNCTNLTVAPELPATALANYCYTYMLGGTGIVVAPELPATVLAPYCYTGMLRGTGIVVAPELPATVLAEGCYNSMLRETSIAISETQTGAYQTPWRIPSGGTIANEATDWSTSMLSGTSGTFTGSPTINTTYYQVG